MKYNQDFSYGNQIIDNLKQFTTEKKFTDVTLKVDDKEYPCHKVILCASSTYFDKMFCSDFKEQNSSVVELFGISQVGFDEIYKYIYSGHYDLNEENAIEVFDVSDMFLFENIREKSLSFIFYNLNEFTCVDYFLFAYKRNILKLMSRAKSVITHMFYDVCFWNDISPLPYDVLLGIIRSKYLDDQNEEDFCRTIYYWIKQNEHVSNSQKDLLLDEIRWGLFEMKDIENIHSYSDVLQEKYTLWKSIVDEHTKGNCNQRIVIEQKYQRNFSIRNFKSKLRVGGWSQNDFDDESILDTITWSFDGYVFATLPTPICHTAAVTVGNHIIVIGGKSAQSDKNIVIESKTFAYDMKFDVWQNLSPLCKPRWQHVAIPFDNNILVVGGRDEKGHITNCVEKFDIVENKWTTMKPFMKLTKLKGCCLNNEVYVCGGFYRTPGSKSSDIFDNRNDSVDSAGWKNHSIYKYNANDDKWIKVCNIPHEHKNFGVSAMGVYNNKIYIGGQNKYNFLVFDPENKSLTTEPSNPNIHVLDSNGIMIPYTNARHVECW